MFDGKVNLSLSEPQREGRDGPLAISMVLLLCIYAGSYAAFRQTNQDEHPKGSAYVYFPSGPIGHALYNVWRPLSYLDSALTGMEFLVRSHPRRKVPR
jgi:hypothetical protein